MKTYLLFLILLTLTVSESSSEESSSQENSPFPEIDAHQKPVEPHAFSFSMLPGVHRGTISQNPYQSVVNTEGQVFPSNIGFQAFAQQRYQPERQQTIFVCKDEEEVQEVLEKLPEGVSVSVRGGGHDFNNASLLGDVIIQLSEDFITESGVDIAKVIQTDNGERVVVNPKTRNADLYKTLYDIDPQFNSFAGTCPSVGISGYILGGGHGLLTPYYGIGAHYLESARFVTASGEVLEVNDEDYPDLMKVLRGGGHNLGVVTEMTFDLRSIPKHNWNYIQYISTGLTEERVQFIYKQYETLVKNSRYETARLRFSQSANGLSSDLLFFTPSNEYSIEELKQIQEEWFPTAQTGYEVLPGSIIEDKPWFELYMQDIPVKGAIGSEMFYQNLLDGKDYRLYISSGNRVSTGLTANYKDLIDADYVSSLISTSINNYRWKQTGPFAEKSVFLPYPDSTQTDILYTMWSMGPRSVNDKVFGIYEDSDLFYVNYIPSDTGFTRKDFFGEFTPLYEDARNIVDPEGRFVDRFNSSHYSHPQPTKN